jgi:hypothetical protein
MTEEAPPNDRSAIHPAVAAGWTHRSLRDLSRPPLNRHIAGQTSEMPNCDFYALAEDCRDVLRFVFDQPRWVLFELASEPDRPLRRFQSLEALTQAFALCEQAPHFQLYAPEMRGSVHERRIDFNPGAVPGATHRFATEGWGLIQLYFGVRDDRGLTASHTNHNSRARASTWSSTTSGPDDPAAWDWSAVTGVSGRLCRYIRERAVTKTWSRPVLPEANAAVFAGRTTRLLNG